MNKRTLSYAEAISEAHLQTMQEDDNCFIMGIGVSDYAGIFNTTLEARKKFGLQRVVETPASENALTGIAIGASLFGKKPVIVHARNDFMFLTLDQMFNQAAKWKYMCNGKSSVSFVARGIIGKGWGQGPTHSQSIQSLFMHFPGLYVAMPATPYDAKGLLINAIHSGSPCVILEHRRLYDIRDNVPEEIYDVPFGKARIARRGTDATLVAASLMMQEGIKAHIALKAMGISLEVIDPRTLRPLDEKTIIKSVKKTGRLICADTSWKHSGFLSETLAVVAEKAHGALKAPPRRIASAECPLPVSLKLEEKFYPTYKDIFVAGCELMGRKPDYSIISDPVIDQFKGPY